MMLPDDILEQVTINSESIKSLINTQRETYSLFVRLSGIVEELLSSVKSTIPRQKEIVENYDSLRSLMSNNILPAIRKLEKENNIELYE